MRIRSMGFMVSYNNNPDFILQDKMITALSFVPKVDTDHHTDALAMNLYVLKWFEDNYIGHPNRWGTGRGQPLFPT